MNLIKEINDQKENEDLKLITEENLETEVKQLMNLGFYERALKLLNNFPEEEVERKLRLVILKFEVLWKIGRYEEWK